MKSGSLWFQGKPWLRGLYMELTHKFMNFWRREDRECMNRRKISFFRLYFKCDFATQKAAGPHCSLPFWEVHRAQHQCSWSQHGFSFSGSVSFSLTRPGSIFMVSKTACLFPLWVWMEGFRVEVLGATFLQREINFGALSMEESHWQKGDYRLCHSAGCHNKERVLKRDSVLCTIQESWKCALAGRDHLNGWDMRRKKGLGSQESWCLRLIHMVPCAHHMA